LVNRYILEVVRVTSCWTVQETLECDEPQGLLEMFAFELETVHIEVLFRVLSQGALARILRRTLRLRLRILNLASAQLDLRFERLQLHFRPRFLHFWEVASE